jgi:pyrroline-5-carboxylate reductase
MVEGPYDLLVIGAGVMGAAIARGVASAHPELGVAVQDRTYDKAAAVSQGVANLVAVRELAPADLIVVAVKPKDLRGLLGRLPAGTRMISIAAGVPLARLREWTGAAVVRAMPNTAIQVREGVIALADDPGEAALLALAEELLGCLGRTLRVPESLFDLVTSVAGSGPAIVFLLLEALQEAAISQGLDAEQARVLAVSMLRGAALLADARAEDPRRLRLEVTSPGGMTAAGIAALEEQRFRWQLHHAVEAAIARARGLAAES